MFAIVLEVNTLPQIGTPRMLVITQTIDRTDSSLGFFVRWVESMAQYSPRVEVICLNQGSFALPKNVTVHSLGKETRGKETTHHIIRRIQYSIRFYGALIRLRGTYDAVFVHMNEEYLLLAGWWWRLTGTPLYFWRNHYEGSLLTTLACWFATRVFCTSQYSYTARFKKTILMPVGVDIDSLHNEEEILRNERSVLFLGRFDASKRPHLLVEALGILKSQGISLEATFVGGPTNATSTYPEEVRTQAETLGVGAQCHFVGAVPNTETYRYYRSHDIFVNCSESGMLDKTIFKAAGAGCIALTSSADVALHVDPICVFKNNDATDLASTISHILSISPEEKIRLRLQYQKLVDENTLSVLMMKLFEVIT